MIMQLFEFEHSSGLSSRQIVLKLKERGVKISPPTLARYKKAQTPVPVHIVKAIDELTAGAVTYEDWAILPSLMGAEDNNG